MSPISQSFKANKVHLKYYLKKYIFHIILTHQDEIADAEISLMQQLEIFTFYKFFFFVISVSLGHYISVSSLNLINTNFRLIKDVSICMSVVVTHPLHHRGITSQSGGQSTRAVHGLIKPADLLSQHGLKAHLSQATGQQFS